MLCLASVRLKSQSRASPKRSRQHILQEHLSDKFIWASTSTLLSEHTNLPQMSARVFTVSLGKQRWSGFGGTRFTVVLLNQSRWLFTVCFSLYRCTKLCWLSAELCQILHHSSHSPFPKKKEIYFPAVINYKHLQYPPRTAVINLHNLVRFTAANIWIRLLILGCKTTNQPPLDHHVGSKMKTGLYNIIITVLYK